MIKDLAFDQDNLVDEFRVKMPIEFCEESVEFKFTAQYKMCLPDSAIGQPLQADRGYMLSTGALFSEDFANNHDRVLDAAQIYCSITNLTQKESNQSHLEKKLFFNKEYLNLGLIFMRVGDQIEIKFYEYDKNNQAHEEVCV